MTRLEKIQNMSKEEVVELLIMVRDGAIDITDICSEKECPLWKECQNDEYRDCTFTDDREGVYVWLGGKV